MGFWSEEKRKRSAHILGERFFLSEEARIIKIEHFSGILAMHFGSFRGWLADREGDMEARIGDIDHQRLMEENSLPHATKKGRKIFDGDFGRDDFVIEQSDLW